MSEKIRIKPISEFPTYLVSDSGDVYSTVGGTIKKRKHQINMHGYPYVCLQYGGVKKNVLVHRLVIFAFGPPPKAGQECDHIDGNRKNCNLWNLRWVSHKENQQNAINLGRIPRGSKCLHAKLDEKKVAEIRKRYRPGIVGKFSPNSLLSLSREFGVSKKTVLNIVQNKIWRHA